MNKYFNLATVFDNVLQIFRGKEKTRTKVVHNNVFQGCRAEDIKGKRNHKTSQLHESNL